jgi:hypothetical protein
MESKLKKIHNKSVNKGLFGGGRHQEEGVKERVPGVE